MEEVASFGKHLHGSLQAFHGDGVHALAHNLFDDGD